MFHSVNPTNKKEMVHNKIREFFSFEENTQAIPQSIDDLNYRYGSKHCRVCSHRTFHPNSDSFFAYPLHSDGRSEK